jgi:hypothetical protein
MVRSNVQGQYNLIADPLIMMTLILLGKRRRLAER